MYQQLDEYFYVQNAGLILSFMLLLLQFSRWPSDFCFYCEMLDENGSYILEIHNFAVYEWTYQLVVECGSTQKYSLLLCYSFVLINKS